MKIRWGTGGGERFPLEHERKVGLAMRRGSTNGSGAESDAKTRPSTRRGRSDKGGVAKAKVAKTKNAPKEKPRGKSSRKAAGRGKASHDIKHPPAFVDFMLRDWATRPRKVSRIKGAERFAKRRQALSEAFPGETIIIPTGREQFRNDDANYRFRANSSFYYLTGNTEPDCVLVLEPRQRGHRSVLFVEPNPGRSSPTFFTDRHKGELWVGPRLGVPESRERFGVDAAEPLDKLDEALSPLKKSGAYRVLQGVDPGVDRRLRRQDQRNHELAVFLAEQRLIKDTHELQALKKAAAATRRGFDDIVRVLPGATNEREVEGAFYARARREGNDTGYNIIAAAGEHACILHWNANNGRLRKGDLLLVDAGIEGDELYTADVTRTLPISGTYSKAQRAVYEIVIAAQRAAIAAVKPGNPFLAPHRAASEVLAQGLVDLGVLRMPVDEILDPEHQFHRRYTLHGTSHMLGLDVHDCSAARSERYRQGTLEPGMVLTIEPGLYFQPDDLTVPKRLRGIGIRIEDDVAVSARGRRVLTDVPREPDDVEAWMTSLWSEG